MGTTKISDIMNKQNVAIAANKEYGPIEMVIREKDEYLEDEEYEIWHIGHHYLTKDELNLNKAMKIALDASSKKDEARQTKEKKKENSERISQSFGFELSSTMDAEQSSRAALICVIMLDIFKGFVLSLWLFLWRYYWLYFGTIRMYRTTNQEAENSLFYFEAPDWSRKERRNAV